jgi:hypothetical protein
MYNILPLRAHAGSHAHLVTNLNKLRDSNLFPFVLMYVLLSANVHSRPYRHSRNVQAGSWQRDCLQPTRRTSRAILMTFWIRIL